MGKVKSKFRLKMGWTDSFSEDTDIISRRKK